MDLILTLMEKFVACPKPRDLDLENYHNNTKNVDKLARKVIKSINDDVNSKFCGYYTANYKRQEEVVEKDSIANFGMLTESDDFACVIASMIKAVRVYSLYYDYEDRDLNEDGISDKEKEYICKNLSEIDQILIYSVLKYFADQQIVVEWKNNAFAINGKISENDLEIINCVCQVMRQCRLLRDYIRQECYCDALEICKSLNFENIFENKSTHLFYY